jgi:hypothetical protein
MLRVIVCGSRKFSDSSLMTQALIELRDWARGRPLTIVHGDAPGADSLAASRALDLIPDVVIEPHPADWKSFGKVAGPLRNTEMVSLGADLGLAFYINSVESRGTDHCTGLMKSVAIPVKTYTQVN